VCDNQVALGDRLMTQRQFPSVRGRPAPSPGGRIRRQLPARRASPVTRISGSRMTISRGATRCWPVLRQFRVGHRDAVAARRRL